MGISASVYWQDQPESFTQDEMRAIFQDDFDEDVYEQLKDQSGCVNRDELVETLRQRKVDETENEIKEVYRLFMSYCPSGNMNSRSFVTFLKDAKLLNKRSFSRAEAQILFEKAKHDQDGASTLHFPGFMKVALPLIAEKIGKPKDVVQRRLASVEHKTVMDLAKVSSVESSQSTSGHQVLVQQTPEDLAAIKLQKVARGKIAQKQMAFIKQVRNV